MKVTGTLPFEQQKRSVDMSCMDRAQAHSRTISSSIICQPQELCKSCRKLCEMIRPSSFLLLGPPTKATAHHSKWQQSRGIQKCSAYYPISRFALGAASYRRVPISKSEEGVSHTVQYPESHTHLDLLFFPSESTPIAMKTLTNP